MELSMVHLPPEARLLNSYANNNLAWWKALAEFTDNSIDAGATRIVIDITSKRLTIQDDGIGCKDITSMFKLGDHNKSKGTKLGRYGIGAKDAWLSCSDDMAVETIANGHLTCMSVNYIEWMKNDWKTAAPVSQPTDKPTGTKILLHLRPGKNKPSKDAFRDLAFAFTPAIKSGIQILESNNGKRIPLAPHEMPSREDVVVSEFEIDGKSVKIDIGILPEGVRNDRGPFWLIHEHRIIDSTSLGAGHYSVQRIAGTITIGSGWKLSKNKDDLTDNQERLGLAIFARIEHILKKADALAETIESAALRDELQQAFNNAIKEANRVREKRKQGRSVGSVSPVNSGRVRRNAAETQNLPGSVDATGRIKKFGGYVLDWCNLDPKQIGKFDRSGCRISLNLDHAFIASMKRDNNRPALMACCSALLADYACRHDSKGNSLLAFDFQDFTEAMGIIACNIGSKEAASNVKAQA